MPQKCAAYNCRSVKSTADVSIHLFPKDEVLKEKWRLATRRANWKPSKNSTLCSKHFEQFCFKTTTSGKRFLDKGAVPSIFDYSDHVKRRPWVNNPRKTVESDEETTHEVNESGALPQISNYYSLSTSTDTHSPGESLPCTSETASFINSLKEDGYYTPQQNQIIDGNKTDGNQLNCLKPIEVKLFTESNDTNDQDIDFMSVDEIKLEQFNEPSSSDVREFPEVDMNHHKNEKSTFEEEQTTSNLVTVHGGQQKKNLSCALKVAMRRRLRLLQHPFVSCPMNLQKKLHNVQVRNRFLRKKLNTLNVETSKKEKTIASLKTEKNDLINQTIDEAMVMVERAFKDVLRKYFNDRSFMEDEKGNDDKVCLHAYITFAKGFGNRKGNRRLVTKLKFKKGDHNQINSRLKSTENK